MEKYFKVIFEIIEVKVVDGKLDQIYEIMGNFIMKDVIKSIIIFVIIIMGENGLSVKMFQFVIDCIVWNVMYGFIVVGVLKDKVIQNEIVLQINFVVK